MFVNFKGNFDNTGAATLSVNGFGDKSIRKFVTMNLDAADKRNGQMVSVIYIGTKGLQCASKTSYQGNSGFIGTSSYVEE